MSLEDKAIIITTHSKLTYLTNKITDLTREAIEMKATVNKEIKDFEKQLNTYNNEVYQKLLSVHQKVKQYIAQIEEKKLDIDDKEEDFIKSFVNLQTKLSKNIEEIKLLI
jgi:uncharacterized ubiquitin-like protein YukD